MRFFERVFFKPKYAISLLFIGACAVAFLPFKTHALTTDPLPFHLGIESHFSRSMVHPSTFPFLRAGIDLQSDQSDSQHEYKIDAEFRISPSHPKAFTLASRNIFWGEKDSSTQNLFRFSYGRKLIGWSNIDELWGLGAFEPLDSWDRLRSTPQGLTGVFAYTETNHLDFRFFVSYLFAPELTPNVIIENNQFQSEHPQSISNAPQAINVIGKPLPVGYNLKIPSITKIIFRPSFAFSMQTKADLPVFVKFSYGYLPLNYFPIAAEGYWDLTNNVVPITLHPRLMHHHLYNGEFAYQASDTVFTGLTTLIDNPVEDALPSTYTYTPLTTAVNISPWAKFKLQTATTLFISHLWTIDGLGNDAGSAANSNGTSLFPSRVLYRNASQIALRHEMGGGENPHHPLLQLKGVHEYSIDANWLAADFYYTFGSQLTFLLGFDMISAEKNAAPDHGAEYLADLKAIDRFRVGVTYAF